MAQYRRSGEVFSDFFGRVKNIISSRKLSANILIASISLVILGVAALQLSFSTYNKTANTARAMVSNPTSDTDGDGIPNYYETDADTDRDGNRNYIDTDSDGDGCPDAIEGRTDPNANGRKAYLDSTEHPNCP